MNKISARIQVSVDTLDAISYVINRAREYVTEDSCHVWLEVQYQDAQTGEWENWDETGDAVEVSFSSNLENAEIRTLSSEEWKAANG